MVLSVTSGVLLGLGLYGYFAGDAAAQLHPLLAHETFAVSLIGVGVFLSVLELGLMIGASRQRTDTGE